MRGAVMRALKWIIVALLGVSVLALVINGVVPHASGPTSSTYSTAADGLRGYAELLSRSGHPVGRLRAAPGQAALDPADTVVMLDPEVVLPSDVRALQRFVRAGGRLVVGGRQPGAWLSELIAGAPTWSSTGVSSASPLLPVPETSGVGVVESAGQGAFTNAGATLPVLADANRALLTVADVGAGRLVVLADPSPLQNQLLAHADNAALGLVLAGPAGRPVAFEEAVHGYGHSSGLAALPTRWIWALGGLIAAALVLVAARFRRLGPPEPIPAAELPPRREYVDALAAALARSAQPAVASEPVRRRARALVLERSGLPPDADAEAVADAAGRLGLDPEEVAALAGPRGDESGVLAAGRALAAIGGREGGTV